MATFIPVLLFLVNLLVWQDAVDAFVAYLNFAVYAGAFVSLVVVFPLYRERAFEAGDLGWVILLMLSFFLLFPVFWYLKIYRPHISGT